MLKKFCKTCNQTLPIEDFGKDKYKRDGHRFQCKKCENLYRKSFVRRDTKKVSSKKCFKCGRVLDINQFSSDTRSVDGAQASCKECNHNYYKNNKEKRKKYIREWCKNNPHKVRQYKQKRKDKQLEYLRIYSKIHGKRYRNTIAKFERFKDQLTIDEAPIADSNGNLLVKCTYCGRYFHPTTNEVTNRVSALNGSSSGERRLYCSGGCKSACPLYNFATGIHYQLGSFAWLERQNSEDLTREVQPELRKLCLARDDYTCQKCGLTINDIELHCHHIDPVICNPIESADLDNCAIFCVNCHYEIHRYNWCSTRRDLNENISDTTISP